MTQASAQIMPGGNHLPPSNEVLADRNRALANKVESLDTKLNTLDTKHTEILVELKVLQTKVGFLAAGIGMATGVASSVAMAVLQKFLH